jgi:hypothetical protein
MNHDATKQTHEARLVDARAGDKRHVNGRSHTVCVCEVTLKSAKFAVVSMTTGVQTLPQIDATLLRSVGRRFGSVVPANHNKNKQHKTKQNNATLSTINPIWKRDNVGAPLQTSARCFAWRDTPRTQSRPRAAQTTRGAR